MCRANIIISKRFDNKTLARVHSLVIAPAFCLIEGIKYLRRYFARFSFLVVATLENAHSSDSSAGPRTPLLFRCGPPLYIHSLSVWLPLNFKLDFNRAQRSLAGELDGQRRLVDLNFRTFCRLFPSSLHQSMCVVVL